tara:strand:+ start:5194 stop:5364 length:171 start_codon:yes stop_codon:yes gene_type:complete
LNKVNKKWLADKSIEMNKLNQVMIDLIKKQGGLYTEVKKIQDEFLETMKNILEEKI